MTMFIKKLAILHKLETGGYGVDSTPAGGANAMQVSNVKFTPMAGDQVPRDIVRPYLGHQGVDLVGIYQQIEFDVELGGSAAAGTAPKIGSLLRNTAMSEVIVATTSVTYQPVSGAYESGSLYYFLDGAKYIMLGCRGKKTLTFESKKKPSAHFTLWGLLGTLTDTALPTADYTAWIEPPVVSKANTQFSFGGVQAPTTSLSIDDGVDLEARFLVNYEGIDVGDRPYTGSLVIDQNLKAVKDWRQIALNKTLQALALTHGSVPGNTIALNSTTVQVGQVTHGDAQGVANQTLPLMFQPTSGNDELSLVFT